MPLDKTSYVPTDVEIADSLAKAIEDARGLIQAWEEGKGSGVVTYNNKMVENLHVESAQRILSMHDAITALIKGMEGSWKQK